MIHLKTVPFKLLKSVWLGAICVAPLLAQGAQVSGLVRDPQQKAVANAHAILTQVSTGVARSVSSGGGGLYAFTFLSPGLYRLAVSAPGFSQQPQFRSLWKQVRGLLTTSI